MLADNRKPNESKGSPLGCLFSLALSELYPAGVKQSRQERSIDGRNFETLRRGERRGSASERTLRPLRLCVSNLQNSRSSQPANKFSEASSKKYEYPIRGNTFVDLDSQGFRAELMTNAPPEP